MTAAPLPDARPDNWVDRLAPRPLRPWLKLGRFDRPIGAWLLMLPGWQGVALADAVHGRLPNPLLLGLIAVGALVMRGAGCAYNDIVDRDIDAKVARTARRPIPSGQVSVRQAIIFVVALSLVGLVILITLKPLAILLGVGSLLLVAAYPFMKRITWWPQAWLGLTFNWGALLGYAAVGGSVGWPALLLYGSGLFWTLGYDTIYAVQDMEDDALVGVKSSALRLGAKAPRAVLGFYVVCAILALAAAAAGRLGPLAYPLILVYAVHLGLQARRLKLGDGLLALRLFRSNREAGLILFAALAAGLWRPGAPPERPRAAAPAPSGPLGFTRSSEDGVVRLTLAPEIGQHSGLRFTLYEEAVRDLTSFLDTAHADRGRMAAKGRPAPQFRRSIAWSVTARTPRLLGLREDWSDETGALHPDLGSTGLVWDILEDRRLEPGELIRAEAGAAQLDQTLCRDIHKAAPAARCPSWADSDFTLTPSTARGRIGGLVFLFDGAALGPGGPRGGLAVVVPQAQIAAELNPAYAIQFAGQPAAH